MLAGELMEFLAAAPVCGFDDITCLVAVLLVVTKVNALAAGRAKGAGICEVRLTAMRVANLMLERVRITVC
jgi:hypothetical protein